MFLNRCVWLVLLSCTLGCVTYPQYPQGGGGSAGYFGDRDSTTFDELVVSVPSDSTRERNLHVVLSAILNPRVATYAQPYESRSIVSRSESRISARVVEVVLSMGAIGPADLTRVRERVSEEAQKVVEQAMAGWEHAGDYEVRMVVVSLYFTDGSVGRTLDRRRW